VWFRIIAFTRVLKLAKIINKMKPRITLASIRGEVSTGTKAVFIKIMGNRSKNGAKARLASKLPSNPTL
jgi:hypothetical protein